MNYFNQHKLKLVEWPSLSPDLNIIGTLWVDLKHAVHARWPNNIAELQAVCKAEWVKNPETRIGRVLADYKRGLQAVICHFYFINRNYILLYYYI